MFPKDTVFVPQQSFASPLPRAPKVAREQRPGGPFFRHRALIATIVVACALSRGEELIERREEFVSRLDSVEMVKQNLKRQGLPLSELETVERALKDSIAACRLQIAPPGRVPETRVDPGRSPRRELFPRNAFDWFIVGLGMVALLCGIVLLAGILQSLGRSGRGKRNNRVLTAGRLAQTASRAAAGADLPSVERDSLPGEEIGSLRERINRNSEHTAGAHLLSEIPPANLGRDGNPSAVSKHRLVTEAARLGMGQNEIARRYHLSVDEVALILRVGRRNTEA